MALGVAVHVVAGTVAVRRVVRLPPSPHHRTGGAVVVPAVDRAAELAEPRAALRPAAAVPVPTSADERVGSGGLQHEIEASADGYGTSHVGGAIDETPTREPRLEEARRLLDQGRHHGNGVIGSGPFGRHRSPRPLGDVLTAASPVRSRGRAVRLQVLPAPTWPSR